MKSWIKHLFVFVYIFARFVPAQLWLWA